MNSLFVFVLFNIFIFSACQTIQTRPGQVKDSRPVAGYECTLTSDLKRFPEYLEGPVYFSVLGPIATEQVNVNVRFGGETVFDSPISADGAPQGLGNRIYKGQDAPIKMVVKNVNDALICDKTLQIDATPSHNLGMKSNPFMSLKTGEGNGSNMDNNAPLFFDEGSSINGKPIPEKTTLFVYAIPTEISNSEGKQMVFTGINDEPVARPSIAEIERDGRLKLDGVRGGLTYVFQIGHNGPIGPFVYLPENYPNDNVDMNMGPGGMVWSDHWFYGESWPMQVTLAQKKVIVVDEVVARCLSNLPPIKSDNGRINSHWGLLQDPKTGLNPHLPDLIRELINENPNKCGENKPCLTAAQNWATDGEPIFPYAQWTPEMKDACLPDGSLKPLSNNLTLTYDHCNYLGMDTCSNNLLSDAPESLKALAASMKDEKLFVCSNEPTIQECPNGCQHANLNQPDTCK